MLAIPVAAVITYLLVWYGPDVLARHDIGSVTGPLRVLRLQLARDAARGRLLTLGAGLFAAGALVYTARSLGLARRQQELSRRTIDLSRLAIEAAEEAQRRTLELTERGRVTDRYTKAIEMLGSSRLDMRIGAVYALERIAWDSATDHPAVMEVVAAFIREHSREQWPPATDRPGTDTPARTTRPDVEAAITVIGRRDTQRDRQRVNLTYTNLTRANLTDANLTDANLTDANLAVANLVGANLTVAHLGGAILTVAILTGANLTGADLTRADLAGADLTRANLNSADLTCAILTRADLTNADLTSANLTSTDLTGADLTGAKWPMEMPVPKGWDRDPGSGRLSRAHADGDASGS